MHTKKFISSKTYNILRYISFLILKIDRTFPMLYWIIIYLITAPLILYLNLFKTKNHHKIIYLIAVFPFISSALTILLSYQMTPSCWIINNIDFLIMCIMLSILYIGWCETIRRTFNRTLHLNFKKVLTYGAVSTYTIILSMTLTTLAVLTLIGCRDCMTGLFILIWDLQKSISENYAPLLC